MIDAVIILLYFGMMAVLGIIGYRKNKTSEDYFVAGKQLGTFSLAAMWMSSWIGGSSIIGTSTDAYNLGISGGWYVLFLSGGCVIFGLIFSKLVKRLGTKLQNITYPALISSRYDSRSGMIVLICCFLANLGFLASQLVAMGSMLTTITGWNTTTCFLVSTVITVAYSAIGGLMAITYTTWLQFILILLGTVVLGIPLSIHAVGGLEQLQTLPQEWFDLGRSGWPTIIALGGQLYFLIFYQHGQLHPLLCGKKCKNITKWGLVGRLQYFVHCPGRYHHRHGHPCPGTISARGQQRIRRDGIQILPDRYFRLGTGGCICGHYVHSSGQHQRLRGKYLHRHL